MDDTLEHALLDRSPIDSRSTIDLASLNAFERFELQINDKVKPTDEDGKPLHGTTLILIGNLGVGKSMFLRRFFSRPCNEALTPTAVPFVIDFRTSPINPDSAVEWIYSELSAQIEKLD